MATCYGCAFNANKTKFRGDNCGSNIGTKVLLIPVKEIMTESYKVEPYVVNLFSNIIGTSCIDSKESTELPGVYILNLTLIHPNQFRRLLVRFVDKTNLCRSKCPRISFSSVILVGEVMWKVYVTYTDYTRFRKKNRYLVQLGSIFYPVK